MISLQNVSKYYVMKSGKKNYVLDDVTLDIPKCNLAILGPNGAGKSTLLRLIGGAEKPNEGTITCQGDVSWPLGLSAGFQGSLTGLENIKFVCKINGLSKKETDFVVNYVLLFSELGEHFDNPIKNYSSGMRAKLAFGLSTAFDFDIFLIDELTSVGDAAFRQKAIDEFEKIKKRASIIYVSHGLQNLRQTCDQALVLNEGKLSLFEDIEEGIETYQKYVLSINPSATIKFAKKKQTKKTTKQTKKTKAKKVATTKKVVKKATKKKISRAKAIEDNRLIEELQDPPTIEAPSVKKMTSNSRNNSLTPSAPVEKLDSEILKPIESKLTQPKEYPTPPVESKTEINNPTD